MMFKTIIFAAAVVAVVLHPFNAFAIDVIYVRPPAEQGGSSYEYTFLYNLDHPSGTRYAYIDNGGDSLYASSFGGTASTTEAYDGTYSFLAWYNASSVRFTTSVDEVTLSAGSIEFWIYVDTASLTGKNPVFECYNASLLNVNMLCVEINSDGTVFFKHRGNNVQVDMVTTETISTQTWQRIRLRWSVSEDKIGVQVGTNDWEDDADGDSVTSETAVLNTLKIGDGTYCASVLTDDVYYDHFQIAETYNTFND